MTGLPCLSLRDTCMTSSCFEAIRALAGSYVVVAEIRVNGRIRTHQIRCRNPAYAHGQIDQIVERERARIDARSVSRKQIIEAMDEIDEELMKRDKRARRA